MAYPRLGRGLSIGIGGETVYGTAVARTVWFRGISESMKRSPEKRPRPTLAEAGGSRNRRRHYTAADMAGGSFEILCQYEGMGLLLQHILWGTPTTGAPSGGIYTHTFKLGANPPTGGLTIEVVRGTGTSEVFEGCRISKATFKIEAGGLMRVSCDVIAETSGGRVSAGSPTYTSDDLELIHHQAGALSFNAVNYFARSIEFVVDNKLATRNLVGSSLTKDPAPSDFQDVLAKVDVEHEADALQTALTADTASDMAITFAGSGSRSFLFEVHNAYLEDDAAPISAVGVINETVNFRGESDGTDEGFEIQIANTQSSAVAA